MFVLNDGNERIKNQEKYRMSTSRRKQLAGRKTLPKNTRRKKKRGRKMLRIIMIPLMILLLFLLFKSCIQKKNQYADVDATQPEMDIQLLDINPYSRPGTTIDHVNGIVVHYTANPGSTAQDNRDYFNGLKDSHETSASSNFVIGLEGEIIQCIPTWEMAYASNDRNADTISIECCHPDENGKFTDATYRSLVQLTAWLCAKYDLTADQMGDWAACMGIEAVYIDKDTDIRRFRNELKWNEAYYKFH